MSHIFSQQAQKWPTIEHECYGIIYSVTKLRDTLLGRRFLIETDHKNLLWLYKAQSAKLVRWRLKLQEYDFDIAHIPGKDNPADAMSRLFLLTRLDFEQEVLENIIYWGDYEGHQEYLAELPINWEEINPVIDEYYKAVNDENDLILRHYLEYLLMENKEKPMTPEEISKTINEFHNTHIFFLNSF